MIGALIIIAGLAALGLYTAWFNGAFLRCPHCRKIGSWRYDDCEPPVVEKDEDGNIQQTTQTRICRQCGKKVVDRWSDYDGRTIDKAG